MPTMADPGTQLGSVEDLGGPTPENYKSDDDSAKLKTPGGTLKQVKDVVNKGAGKADPMPAGMKEEEEVTDEVVAEAEETTEEEVVAEAETTEEEVVSEEEVTETEEIVAEYNVEEDVNALLAGEELSEEFQEKARTIFETAINAKVATIREELEASTKKSLQKKLLLLKSHSLSVLILTLSMLLTSGCLKINSQLKQVLSPDMTESFLTGMKSLLKNIM